jgi:signal transduction histidine kinase
MEPATKLWPAWVGCFYLLVAYDAGAAQQPKPDANRQAILTESERAWVQRHPVVTWGVDPQWPPFSSFDERGKIGGIDVDMVRLIASRTGLELRFVPTRNWTETLNKASTGELDFVGGIARTEERDRLLGLRFTHAFCHFPTAIVTRKEMPFLTCMQDLKSRRVALPRNYATTEALQRLYPDTPLMMTTNEEESMLAVAASKADATALNLASAGYIVHMRGLSNLKISGFTEADFFLSLAVRQDLPELYSILEKGLASVGPREKEAIYAAYITTQTRRAIDWKVWRRRLIYSLAAGTAISLAMLLRNRRLTREIGRRKAVEASLQLARDRLQEDARQLDCHARQMELLNHRLTVANQDLEAFSYSVSHDLKAPLRRLRGFAEMITLDTGGTLDSTTEHSVKAIQQESQRMGDLIEALLALARVDRGQLHVARVNLEQLVREVIQELEVETQGRQVHWEVRPLPEIECDRGLMKQVLANLLGNAAKFTRGRLPAAIEIGALTEKTSAHELVCFVKDNGAGFDQNQAGTLFQAFHRLHRRADYEGSGIGLATVKRIIQRHGGRVWAEGELDRGATFYFSLAREPGTTTSSSQGEVSRTEQRDALIIDP